MQLEAGLDYLLQLREKAILADIAVAAETMEHE